MDFWPQLAASFFQVSALIKIFASILIVIGLSLAAERVGPRFAGILSGYPLGGALSLFFIGWEAGPDFAARSAVYAAFGLTATLFFVGGYYAATRFSAGLGRINSLLVGSAGGLAAYFAVALVLRPIRVGALGAALSALVSIMVFDRVFRKTVEIKIQSPRKLSLGALLARAGFAALVILLITSSARLVGSAWAGIFSSFPITMFPFLVIIHAVYSPEHVYGVIRNIPKGVVSLLLYCLTVSWTYEPWGLWAGTAAADAAATLYLAVIHLAGRPRPPDQRM